MMKEFTLQIQSYGETEQEAVERAIRILNDGADFDRIIRLQNVVSSSEEHTNDRL